MCQRGDKFKAEGTPCITMSYPEYKELTRCRDKLDYLCDHPLIGKDAESILELAEESGEIV